MAVVSLLLSATASGPSASWLPVAKAETDDAAAPWTGRGGGAGLAVDGDRVERLGEQSAPNP